MSIALTLSTRARVQLDQRVGVGILPGALDLAAPDEDHETIDVLTHPVVPRGRRALCLYSDAIFLDREVG
jgi:hypothetical protein